MKKPSKPVPKKTAALSAAKPAASKMPSKTEPKSNDLKPAPAIASSREQAVVFEKGMAHFRRRDFAKAKELFGQACAGPSSEVSHAAQMHVRMCERRLKGERIELKTPDDHYNYGIAMMNQRRLEDAETHLRQAVNGNDQAGHFYYALALCCGLRGNLAESAAHLRRAIEIEPGNRVAALNDADFQSFAAHPPLRDVLWGERRTTG